MLAELLVGMAREPHPATSRGRRLHRRARPRLFDGASSAEASRACHRRDRLERDVVERLKRDAKVGSGARGARTRAVRRELGTGTRALNRLRRRSSCFFALLGPALPLRQPRRRNPLVSCRTPRLGLLRGNQVGGHNT